MSKKSQGNSKIIWTKWNWKYNLSKLVECSKVMLRGEFVASNANVRKLESSKTKDKLPTSETTKRREIWAKTKQSKGNMKIRVENNEIAKKKTRENQQNQIKLINL